VDRYYRRLRDATVRDEVALGFKHEYLRIRADYTEPEDVIWQLEQYILGNQNPRPKLARAAQAIVAYFFESCDVFGEPTLEWLRSRRQHRVRWEHDRSDQGIAPDRALLTVGATIIDVLSEGPLSLAQAWNRIREEPRSSNSGPLSFSWFALALDLLYAVGLVTFSNDLIRLERDRREGSVEHA